MTVFRRNFGRLLSIQDKKGRTPLEILFARGSVEAINVLLTFPPVFENLVRLLQIKDKQGDTPLHTLFARADAALIAAVLSVHQIGSEIVALLKEVEEENGQFYTPLHLLCYLGTVECLRAVIANPAINLHIDELMSIKSSREFFEGGKGLAQGTSLFIEAWKTSLALLMMREIELSQLS